MNKNKILLFTGILFFVGITAFALWREMNRNLSQIAAGISGTIHLGPGTGAGIVKTDNAHVILFDPQSLAPVALKKLNPFVPPLTFYVGQENAFRQSKLQGEYRLLVITDKNANIEQPVPGEWIGELTAPIALGTEDYQYVLTQPFQQMPRELLASRTGDPQKMIQGTISVAPELQSNIEKSDRLVIMLFDPKQQRPVAFKILPGFSNNMPFSIGTENAMPGQTLEGSYSLRILTDKNNQPFQSAPGEIVGRSQEPIPLGTKDLQFKLDQPYQ